MGARVNENRIELLVDSGEFRARVGMIEDYLELEWLGFKLNNICGIFRSQDLPNLIAFCRDHPNYHIVSSLGSGRYINKYDPSARSYALANGDKNRSLALNYFLNPQWPLIVEDTISKALTELQNIKDRNKR